MDLFFLAMAKCIIGRGVNPSGVKEINSNGDHNVFEFETARVNVPTPIMPEEYAIGGSISDGSATGYYIKRGATEIKQNMFKEITNLEFVDIPNSVTYIGNSAFLGLRNIENMVLSTNLETIGVSAFANCYKLKLTNGLPNSLISIGGGAFQNCQELNFDEMPNSVTTIGGAYAFYGCSKLELKKLSSSLTAIPGNCFSSTKLKITEIPSSVETIDTYAFFNISTIASITFKGTPLSIAANAFGSCPNLYNIYCPWSEGAVANAPWGAVNATITYDYNGGGDNENS